MAIAFSIPLEDATATSAAVSSVSTISPMLFTLVQEEVEHCDCSDHEDNTLVGIVCRSTVVYVPVSVFQNQKSDT